MFILIIKYVYVLLMRKHLNCVWICICIHIYIYIHKYMYLWKLAKLVTTGLLSSLNTETVLVSCIPKKASLYTETVQKSYSVQSYHNIVLYYRVSQSRHNIYIYIYIYIYMYINIYIYIYILNKNVHWLVPRRGTYIQKYNVCVLVCFVMFCEYLCNKEAGDRYTIRGLQHTAQHIIKGRHHQHHHYHYHQGGKGLDRGTHREDD